MTHQEDTVVEGLWKTLSDQLQPDQVRRVSVRHLIPLTGKRNLTGRARVRIAEALTSRGFAFAPESVLTEKDHGDQSELYIFGPGSQLVKVLKLVKEPSETGERQLQALEGRLRSATIRKPHIRRSVEKSGKHYLWNS